MMAARLYPYPKAYRLRKTDEFSSVFALRPVQHSRHFVMHLRDNDLKLGRLGVVVGKKFAPRAAERNLVKRQVRELFRLRQAALAGVDVVIRMHGKFPRAEYPSRTKLRLQCRKELERLLDSAAQRVCSRIS